MSSNKYFAVDKAEECVGYLESAAENWYNSIQRNNYLEKMIRSWSYYYGDFYDAAHEITFSGESGELVNMPIGHYRNIAQHILINITSSRPAFQCRAINEDRKSMIQATLGNGILQYYMREKRYERKLRKATEYAVVMGTGYILTEWNSTKGGVSDELPIDTNLIYDYDEDGLPLDENGVVIEPTPIFRGDIESRVLSPLDVVFDFTKDDPEMNDWYLVRIFANKYDLAAKYPEMKDDILRIDTKGSNSKRVCLSPYNETTDIPLYAFYHKSTESTPKGRYILYANKDTILEDTGLPYTDLPLQRIAPSDILGSSFGYTPMFDLLPIQDAINSVYSTVLTNHNAFGVQNIINPMGNNVKFTQVSDGLNWIEYDKEFGAPAPLQLTKSSPESFNLIGMLEKVMETISGINSVSRGNPEASLKSGTALALIQAQALTFMSGLQQSYIQLLEDSATFIIDLLKEFGDQPRTIAIAGISNIQKMKQFNNDDLQSISRVSVDVGNSMMSTAAGRWQVAENLSQMGLITTPEHFLEILNTGSLSAATSGLTNELDVIRAENEALLYGNPIIAIAIDKHAMHIREHRDVLSDPNSRFDTDLVERTLAHIMEHITLMRETDPALLAIYGEQPVGPANGSPPAGQGAPKPTSGGDMSETMQEGEMVQPSTVAKPAQPPAPFQNMAQTPQDLMQQQGG
jgi:hypothetical protein